MGLEINDMHAAVVHDVKNQLAELALLLNARGDAQQELGIAITAARRLSELLLMQRQESGMLDANIDSADPADTLNMLAAEYRVLFPTVALHVHTGEAPEFGFFDDALVRLALANAVHNACRHARTEVRLSAGQEEEMLVFEVADDGPGFPVGMLVSDHAQPAPASRGGTGMGLYLAEKIAALHTMKDFRGRIELSNRDGGVFRMLLP